MTEVIHNWNAYLTEDFSDEEMEQFNAMLDRITRRATDAVNKEFEDGDSPPAH